MVAYCTGHWNPWQRFGRRIDNWRAAGIFPSTAYRLINYVGNAKEWTRSGSGVAARGGAHTDPMSKCDVQLQETHNGTADPLTGFRVVREMG